MKNYDKVLCFGEILWDNLPTGALPGGAPMNVALHLSRFGIKATVTSCVGNDKKGDDLLAFLKASGLEINLIQMHPILPTSEVLVHLDEHNIASYEIRKPVAWDEILLTNPLTEELKASTAIVFGSLASRSATTRNTLLKLLESDILKVMDVNLRPPYDTEDIVKSLLVKSDIVKLNDEELITISEWYHHSGTMKEKMKSLYTLLNLKTLIVTMGKDGATVLHENELYYHDGYKVTTVDSVGAGDAFLAGFLAAMFDKKPVPEALREACAIGAYVTSKSGATPLYTRDVIYDEIFS